MSSWLVITVALASALMGGVFWAFSSFIMPALGRIPPAEATRAMQRINIDVFHLRLWRLWSRPDSDRVSEASLAVRGFAGAEPPRLRWRGGKRWC